jgi:hypothetical protein
MTKRVFSRGFFAFEVDVFARSVADRMFQVALDVGADPQNVTTLDDFTQVMIPGQHTMGLSAEFFLRESDAAFPAGFFTGTDPLPADGGFMLVPEAFDPNGPANSGTGGRGYYGKTICTDLTMLGPVGEAEKYSLGMSAARGPAGNLDGRVIGGTSAYSLNQSAAFYHPPIQAPAGSNYFMAAVYVSGAISSGSVDVLLETDTGNDFGGDRVTRASQNISFAETLPQIVFLGAYGPVDTGTAEWVRVGFVPTGSMDLTVMSITATLPEAAGAA